jgi:hypothetical protein
VYVHKQVFVSVRFKHCLACIVLYNNHIAPADIFRAHTTHVTFDVATSGVEWWVQVRTGGDGREDICFHCDKDEDLVDSAGVNVHPHLSTVTYLTSCGAPTVLLDKTAGVQYDDTSVLYGGIDTAFVSQPRLGKHLVFDGRWLHGAPSALANQVDVGARRITFLANIWLNYHPSEVERLPVDEVPVILWG